VSSTSPTTRFRWKLERSNKNKRCPGAARRGHQLRRRPRAALELGKQRSSSRNQAAAVDLVSFGVGSVRFSRRRQDPSLHAGPVVRARASRRDAAYAADKRQLIDSRGMVRRSVPLRTIWTLLAIPITTASVRGERRLISNTDDLAADDPKASNDASRRCIGVASHELAHQCSATWFTIAYWTTILGSTRASRAGWPQIAARFEPALHSDHGALNTRDTALTTTASSPPA